VNTLAVRLRVDGTAPTYAVLLARVREAALEAYAHQDVPFERIVEEVRPERDPSRNPLFQVLFALQNVPEAELRLPGLSLGSVDFETRTAQFDLEVSLSESDGGVAGRLQWSTDLFDRATMERLAERFRMFLAGVAVDPETPLDLGAAPAEAPAHDGNRPRAGTRTPAAAASPLEALVASAVEHVLGIDAVQPGDDFFELGGHSLLATRLVARLRRIAGADIPVRTVFERPTVRELAVALGE
jgi:non-ribosomal peptide synthetase component F